MVTGTRDLTERAAEFRAAYPPCTHLDLQIEDCAIRVHSNSPELVDALRLDYRAYVVSGIGTIDVDLHLLEAPAATVDVPLERFPPAPGKTVVKDEYRDLPDGRLLRKRLTGMLFLFGPSGNYAVGPCLANRNQVINFINNRFIQLNLDRGYLLCHAAGIVKGDRGIALAGMSGAGKSTLALELLGRDCKFASNDRLMIRRRNDQPHLLGVPKLPRINPGTILNNPRLRSMLSPEEQARFERMPTEELWELEQKHDVDLERCYGPDRIQLTSPLGGVGILTWKRGGGPAVPALVDLAQRRDLLEPLIKTLGAHYRVPEEYPTNQFAERDYLEVLKGVPVLEVSGGVDFPRAADACLALLEGRRPE
jgi:HprK-related kinase B